MRVVKGAAPALLLILAGSVSAQVVPPTNFTTDFEADAVGAAVSCSSGLTGGGPPVDWQIVDDPTAPSGPKVLTEVSGDRTGNRFPVCIFDAVNEADVEVSVGFTTVSGQVDQAAGLMLRVRDADNYYIARANALEDNIRFYRVVNGRREQLAGINIDVPPAQWQTLGLRMRGSMAEVLFNGTVIFSASDTTFSEPGAVGIWTKSDSVTHFDQFTATPLD
jgi:hypothetical protein